MTSRTAVRLAYAADAFIAVLWLSGIGWLAANHAKAPNNNTIFLFVLYGLTAGAYAAVGTTIAKREPTNAIAWLSFVVGAGFVAGLTGVEYFVHGVFAAPGSLPAPDVVLAIVEPTPFLALGGILVVLFLFPTGRPLNRFWSWVAFGVGGLTIAGVIADLLTPKTITDVWASRMEDLGVSAVNPFGVQGFEHIGYALKAGGSITLAVGFPLAIASLIARRRRADAETRAQLRWLGYVAVATLVWIVVMLPLMVITDPVNGPLGAIFWLVITPLIALGVPAAIGIAMVKYRLYEIDVVIRKTVVVAVVAVAVVALYLLVIALATLGVGSRLLLGALLLLITFRPVVRTARTLADRVAFGKRASSYEVLTEFTARVGETYASEDVLPRMAQILAEGTGAQAARILIRVGGELREAAATGAPGGDEHQTPVLDRGEELGALAVTMPANDPMNPAKQQLVDDLAHQAGLVLRNVRLIEELRASRQRLVAAQDEERRKLERNLHDGAQQQLVALAVQLKLAERLVGKDPEKERELLATLASQASAAVDDLRDLARGIYPPLLADKGLVAALDAQARKAAVPTEVKASGIGRYAQEVETAVYFCSLEALNNVAKYAEATQATIALFAHDRTLGFRVTDDGKGFNVADHSGGTGLLGMRDRLDAISGALEVTSAPGAGTTIEGQIPAQPVKAAP